MAIKTERALSLNDGRSIPAVGFGTWPLTGADATRTVGAALQAGYRLVDTAARYENEREVGAALGASGLPRRELFVTTKLRGSEHGYRSTLRALDRSLERLGLEDVDLYLIHWPLPRLKLYVESWKAMIELRERGKALSIGVSNFEPEHIDALIDATGVAPAVNQVELHPEFSQPALRAYHSRKGIVTEAWRPLGKGSSLSSWRWLRFRRARPSSGCGRTSRSSISRSTRRTGRGWRHSIAAPGRAEIRALTKSSDRWCVTAPGCRRRRPSAAACSASPAEPR